MDFGAKPSAAIGTRWLERQDPRFEWPDVRFRGPKKCGKTGENDCRRSGLGLHPY
jgi:hypothetical protein